MAIIKECAVFGSVYNDLPLIQEVCGVPETDKQDLEDLRLLLDKHNVPKGVSVRLIHKHFDVRDDEIMIFEHIETPIGGEVQIMRPAKAENPFKLHGIHYFVDCDRALQAYEYVSHDVVDLSDFGPFLTEFCEVIAERGLQMKFGLRLESASFPEHKNVSWTEFEFPEKRSTIMFPAGLPMPDGPFEVSVSTVWTAPSERDDLTAPMFCEHWRHCYHNPRPIIYDSLNDEEMKGFNLGGRRISPGTPLFSIVTAVADACVL